MVESISRIAERGRINEIAASVDIICNTPHTLEMIDMFMSAGHTSRSQSEKIMPAKRLLSRL
jgi:hypothetical protein